MSTQGYTLLELLVVMAVMGLLATLAAPLAQHAIDNATLRADERSLVSALRETQHRAVASQSTTALAITGARPVLSFGGDIPLSNTARVAVSGGGKILYYPGGMTTGGTVTLAEGVRSVQITVSWLTGDIAVEDLP